MHFNGRFTLRVSILTIFLSLFIVLVFALIYVSNSNFSKSLRVVSQDYLEQVSTTVLKELNIEVGPAEAASILTGKLIEDGTLDINNFEQMISYTVNVVEDLPQVDIASWGDEKGNSISSNMGEDGTISTEIVNRNVQPAEEILIKRNTAKQIISRVKVPFSNFDPRDRPWYRAARDAKKTAWSDIYVFYTGTVFGVTSATPAYNKRHELVGVFGVDVKLNAISRFLEKQKIGTNGIAFIVGQHGELIGFPFFQKFIGQTPSQSKLMEIKALQAPWLVASYYQYLKSKAKEFDYTYNGVHYLAAYLPIPAFAKYGWLVGVVVPENDFVGKLTEINVTTTVTSLIILLIGTILVSMFSERISRPLKLLVKETDKIKNFQLDDEKLPNSYINEVDILAKAIFSMKMGLRSFQKYVPASLVRLLVQSGEDVHAGGSKRDITILFTDIQDFTKLAETTEPQQLMLHVCEYFDELTKIILAERGTLDKYIGDSIMAFWGAPLPDAEHSLHAVRAAVHCLQRVTELNKLWVQQGKAPLITRMGIHTGTALVGNIGSSERLNYTVLGDVINIASRLEGTNKIYGTNIIISHAVEKIIGNEFPCRLLDCIAVKGKEESTFIYELMNQKDLSFDLPMYRKYFASGFQAYQNQNWNEAIVQFQHCLQVYPADKVALLFIERCENFKISPPPANWDGVWRGTAIPQI